MCIRAVTEDHEYYQWWSNGVSGHTGHVQWSAGTVRSRSGISSHTML